MRVPYSWLRSYCDPGLDPEQVGETLGMHSIELERISHVGAPSEEGFVIGRVLSAERHPNADRLSVCEVDAGEGPRTIVCGAPNVAAGQTVPVALPGAVLPDGTKLGKATLRGVESNGMILSEAELEIGDDADGIVIINSATSSDAERVAPDGAPSHHPGVAGLEPGTPLSRLVPVSEPVIELEPTSNRVDCLGVYGVARELHAVSGAGLASAPWEEDAPADGEGEVGDYASVTVAVPELCPRFTARVFTDVRIGPSPLWLKARLVASGMRPINNVVDITNYVMLTMAQPSHAFDLDKVGGGALIIRRASEGEAMTTLDGLERRFDSETVLVCDREGPSGIAGIMGGQASEVSDSTTRVLLEIATWNGINILRTSRKLGLRSDASNRFEKQLHPELALRAQRLASRLMVELCGARLVPGTIDVAAEVPEPHRIHLRGERVGRLLGMEVEPELRHRYLERLGFEVSPQGEDLDAVVPVHRHYDVTREVDLIEEVGRIHGYADNLEATLPKVEQGGGLSREQVLRRRAEDVMRDLGFDGIVTLSLIEPEQAQKLRILAEELRAKPIRISNPLSSEHSALRTLLLGSLLDAARYNRAHGAERVALFESARAYLTEGSSPAGGVLGGEFVGERGTVAYEPHRIAALASGALRAPGWRAEAEKADFYALKGVLEALAAQLGAELAVEAAQEPFLHPGRAARILIQGEPAGWIGELHPLVCRAWDLEAASAFEFELAQLVAASPYGAEQYEDVVSYPAVNQDIAVVVPEETAAAEVRAAVLKGAGELLDSIELFDLYRGKQLGQGRKSIAMRLCFRAPDRTLTDEEVAGRRGAIESALAEIGGSLRE